MHVPFSRDDHPIYDLVVGTLCFLSAWWWIMTVEWWFTPLPPDAHHELCGIERVVVDDPDATQYTFWTRDDHGTLVPRVVRGDSDSFSREIREDVPAGRAMCVEWWVRQHWYNDEHSIDRLVVHVHGLADVGDGAWTDKHGSHPLHTLP